MSWNGSNKESGSASSARQNQKNDPHHSSPSSSPSTFNFRALAAGLIVVALGGVAIWWFVDGREAPETPQNVPKTPRPVVAPTPPLSTNAPVAKKKRPKFPGAPLDWDKPYPPQAYWPDGRLKQHSRYVKVITNKVSEANMTIEELTFSNHAERAIAMLANLQPGEGLVGGGPTYGKAFVKQFKKSLETPIEFSESDTSAQTELKKAVIEMKKELKARMDAGEDVSKIMNDAYAENRELSLYRQELEDQVAAIRKEKRGELSDNDIRDLIDAANKMLSERGAAPLQATKLFEMRMRMKAARAERAESKKQKEKNK